MTITRGGAAEDPHGLELAPGSEVAGFIIEGRLGAGSFGALYQARRGRRRFAIKLVLRDERGEREVDALRRVRELPVVGFHGYGLWPEEHPRFIVLALELVEGAALDTWAREHNPSAHALLTQVMGPLVSALGRIHAAGVVHRDVKEANILMRREDGQPVLVDFGAAGYEGAPRLTLRLPPGTPEYQSPEVLRFAREWDGEPPPERPGDDLWALGVTLYALLTRTLPFGDRHGPLTRTILEATPEPPHVRNPRVPPRLGALCLRMLAKAPGERHADAAALARDLEDALAEAGTEGPWHEPLFPGGREAWAPPEPETDGTLVLQTLEVPAPRVSRWRRWGPGVLAACALGALMLAPWLRDTPEEQGLGSPPPTSALFLPTQQTDSRHEMAREDMTGEVVSNAGPQKSPTPAPVAHATPPEDTSMSVSTTNRLITALALTVGLCTAPGCATVPKRSAQPELVAPPCPVGSAQTHKALGLDEKDEAPVKLSIAKLTPRGWGPTAVTPGLIYVELHDVPWGDMPIGTRFKGELHMQEDRVYGWFTEVFVPGRGPMPVCMETLDDMKRKDGYIENDLRVGTENIGPGPRGSTQIHSVSYLGTTDQFHTHY